MMITKEIHFIEMIVKKKKKKKKKKNYNVNNF